MNWTNYLIGTAITAAVMYFLFARQFKREDAAKGEVTTTGQLIVGAVLAAAVIQLILQGAVGRGWQ